MTCEERNGTARRNRSVGWRLIALSPWSVAMPLFALRANAAPVDPVAFPDRHGARQADNHQQRRLASKYLPRPPFGLHHDSSCPSALESGSMLRVPEPHPCHGDRDLSLFIPGGTENIVPVRMGDGSAV